MSVLKIPFDVLARIDEEIRFLGSHPDHIRSNRWCLALTCKLILQMYRPILFKRLTCKVAIDVAPPLLWSNSIPVRTCDSCPPLTHVYQHARTLVMRFYTEGREIDEWWGPPPFSPSLLTTLPKMHQLSEIVLHSPQTGLWPGLADVIFSAPSLEVLRVIDMRWPTLMFAYDVSDLRIPARGLRSIIYHHSVHYTEPDAYEVPPEIELRSHDERVIESQFLHRLASSQRESLSNLEIPSESFAASLFLDIQFPVLTHLRLFGVSLLEPLQLPLLMRTMPSLRNLYIEIVQSMPSFHLLTPTEAASSDTVTAFRSLRALSLVNCYPDDPIFLFLPPGLVSLSIISDPIRLASWPAARCDYDEPMLVPTPGFWGPSEVMCIFSRLPLQQLEYLRLAVTSDITPQAVRCLVHGRPVLVRLDLHFGPWSQRSVLRVSLPYVVDVLSSALADTNVHFLCLDADWENEERFAVGTAYRRYQRRDLYFQRHLFDYWSSVATALSSRISSLWRVAFAFMAVNRKVLAWGRWQVFHVTTISPALIPTVGGFDGRLILKKELKGNNYSKDFMLYVMLWRDQ
ncbi:hypothetical protein FISHEDRAFT_62363 [Fistulina hepatica ATCC 64428]|nr:hypothetical protein FISHEDRAFT_62363 [Fistulina hepatica ATCC 64428]